MTPKQFQQRLLSWFDQHGRKELPWQFNKTPYRVWISEIMLQQTQVATVIPYYLRFMSRFPTVDSLAAAAEDDVLHLWAGLGYYSRARNLLKAAKMIVSDFNGLFPNTDDGLQKLPGIGQSTAGAILSIAFQQRATILDGNVKRVLSRFHGITDPINQKETENRLWDYADRYSPTMRCDDYTQAIMDLGATICTRSKPMCAQCPLVKTCLAYQQDLTTVIPAKLATRKIPVKTATFLLIKQKNQVLLHKRPAKGIWGGLWSVPELSGKPNQTAIRRFVKETYGIQATVQEKLPAFRHTFSHYHLDIHPVCILLDSESGKIPSKVMEDNQQIWYNTRRPSIVGLPKPVQTLLQSKSK